MKVVTTLRPCGRSYSTDASVAFTGSLTAAAGSSSETPPGESRPAPASVVQRLFGGELASTVVCAECGHVSTAVEPFMCVAAIS